ncbi:MAG: cobyric acid synthase, partial [Clostridiaceae bacterium]|nr:cobyric acid synthase [Clostridiaceae bacterium]
KEMGRAQVLQAYAAGQRPEAYMNPILLKPTTDKKCQVIVKGKVFCNSSASEYHNMKLEFSEMLKKDFEEIEKKFEIIVMEGAGSPAEINLRDRDIVNMGMAELVDAPVVLVGDIDKGGVFAALAGTMLLLEPKEKERVKGTIINKFRGDLQILKPGLKMIEDIIKIPCLGVVPNFELQLEDEDGAVEFNKKATKEIDIAVIKLPHMSNFTDFDALKIEEDVSVRFITSREEFGHPDLLIIPGTKNTIEDLLVLRESGLEEDIIHYGKSGTVIGICGGFQMLGNVISDPDEVETGLKNIEGMKLLDIDTVFIQEKVATRVQAMFNNERVYGYEIHMGVSTYGKEVESLFTIVSENEKEVNYPDGAINKAYNVMGTYIHGIFDGIPFRQHILNKLRVEKGLMVKEAKTYENLREIEIDKLADIVRNSIDMKKIYEIINL